MAPKAHQRMQLWQAVQVSPLTRGLVVECMLSLPWREAAPMPKFFSVPPKPLISWPLKWLIPTMASASTISGAISTSRKCLSSTVTGAKRLPRRPPPMTTGAPTADQSKPLAIAVS